MGKLNRFVRRIGACKKCMREAFLVAAASWTVFALLVPVGLIVDSRRLIIAAAVVAVCLTVLWTVHLAVFAARALATGPGTHAEGSVAPIVVDQPSRRLFVSRFATVFVGAAIATGFGLGRAHAAQWYECGGVYCGGNACCPASHPMLNHCDCRCYQSSNDFSNCGSYNQCVLDGSNCQG